MILNFIFGLQNYISSNDGLVWNSLNGYGVAFPFMLGIGLIWFWSPRRILSPVAYDFK